MDLQPVDFTTALGPLPDPLKAADSERATQLGLQSGELQNQAAQQAMALQRLAIQRQQAFGQGMQQFVQNPSSKGLAALYGAFPEFAKQAGDAWGALEENRKRTDLTQLGAIASLSSKGQYDKAADILQQRVDADRAAGRDDPADDAVLEMLKSGDPVKQRAALGVVTAHIYGAAPEQAKAYLDDAGLSQKPVPVKQDEGLYSPQGDQLVAPHPNLVMGTVKSSDGSEHPVFGNPNPGTPGAGMFGAAAVGGAAPAPAGASGTPPAGASAGATGSRADRNNNPGNLRAVNPKTGQPVSWVTHLPGYQGADPQGYAIFAPGTSGQQGQQALLGRYFSQGRNTVASIVEHWAPRQSAGGDNTDAQVNNYISYVARQMGVDPNKPLPEGAIPQLAAAMHRFESGATGKAGGVRVPPAQQAVAPNPAAVAGAAASGTAPTGGVDPYTGVPTGGPAPLNTKEAPAGYAWNASHTGVVPIPGGEQDPNSYDPKEVDDLARNWIPTGQWGGGGMGGGNIPPGLKKAAMARASQIMQLAGITGDNLPTFRARYGADKAALQNISGIANGLQASESALLANLHQVQITQQQLVHDGIIGDTPFLNKGRLAWARQFGTAEQKAHVKAYEDALNGGQTEYAKFMSTQTGMGNAPTTDSARSRAGELLDEEDAPAATLAGLHQLQIEAQNKKNGVLQQRAALEQKLSSYLQPKGPGTAVQIRSVQQYRALPKGTPYIDPNGVHRVKQ